MRKCLTCHIACLHLSVLSNFDFSGCNKIALVERKKPLFRNMIVIIWDCLARNAHDRLKLILALKMEITSIVNERTSRGNGGYHEQTVHIRDIGQRPWEWQAFPSSTCPVNFVLRTHLPPLISSYRQIDTIQDPTLEPRFPDRTAAYHKEIVKDMGISW
ncbi:hypothetical protein BJX65DRAFT_251122 [Aspergillus insuetus]